MQQLDTTIVAYVEAHILPQYNAFDAGHQQDHVRRVIDNSLKYAHRLSADLNMAYVIAAYHDLGMSGARATHHLLSGELLAADSMLPQWFTADQLIIMRQAVEDHRASADHAPRSIYGCIVSEADRDIVPELVILRAVQFGLANYPEFDREQQYLRVQQHLREKYGEGGYLKLWISDSDNEMPLRRLRTIINDPRQLRPLFDQSYDQSYYPSYNQLCAPLT